MKTTLTVDIKYNGRKTDPESLASAMDRLLETALSTPGILEEYGEPRVGEFFVATKPAPPPRPRIVLNISGGVLAGRVRLPHGNGRDPGRLGLRRMRSFRRWHRRDFRRAGRHAPGERGGIPRVSTRRPCRHGYREGHPNGRIGPAPAGPRRGRDHKVMGALRLRPEKLATTRVHDSYQEAAEDAKELNNVLVLPLVYEEIVVRGDSQKGPSDG